VRTGPAARVVAIGIVLGCLVSARPPAFMQATTSGQDPIGEPDGREFVVRLTPAVPMNTCAVAYVQTGPFGAYGGTDGRRVRNLGAGTFALRTGVGGQPAEALKIAVWCRGYATTTLDISSLASSTFESTVLLSPLPDVTMTGRLLPSPDGVNLAGATLRVFYVADWLCGFFNLADCMVPQWEIAVERIADDGTFRVELPDFAGDGGLLPSITRAFPRGAGGFRLRADRDVAPYDYWLEPDGATFGRVPVAASYADLVLRPRRH
jgi:hypothetical protein